jgi:cell division septal protein FtsQ
MNNLKSEIKQDFKKASDFAFLFLAIVYIIFILASVIFNISMIAISYSYEDYTQFIFGNFTELTLKIEAITTPILLFLLYIFYRD